MSANVLHEAEAPIVEDVPKRVGFCSNPVNLIVVQGEMIPILCRRPVYDDDIEMVELPGNKFCCGPCVDKLLTVAVASQTDLEKERRAHRKNWKGASVDGRARVPKGKNL